MTKPEEQEDAYQEPESHDDPEINLKRKLDAMANINLFTTAIAQDGVSALLEDLTEEQRAEIEIETKEIASSYEELLHNTARTLSDPESRRKIIAELLQRM